MFLLKILQSSLSLLKCLSKRLMLKSQQTGEGLNQITFLFLFQFSLFEWRLLSFLHPLFPLVMQSRLVVLVLSGSKYSSPGVGKCFGGRAASQGYELSNFKMKRILSQFKYECLFLFLFFRGSCGPHKTEQQQTICDLQPAVCPPQLKFIFGIRHFWTSLYAGLFGVFFSLEYFFAWR